MARKPIRQRIELDGGKEIERQLKDLGEAGEKAFEQIRKAALKADFAKFGASLKTFGNDLATVARRVTLAFTGIATAATAAGVGVFKLAQSGGEAADQSGKAAEKAGLQVEAYGRLAFAAERADVSLETFQSGMNRLNKTLGAAASGSKDALKQFADLGVTIFDAKGQLRPTEAIIQDIAGAFARMPNGARKSALAIALFGKSGAELIPFLNEGAQGLRALGREAERLGIVFTEQQFQLGDRLGDAIGDVGIAVRALKNQLGLLFAPAIIAGAETLREFIVRNKDALIELGRVVERVATGFLSDLVNALAGNDARVRRPWILVWRNAIVQFGSDVAAVVNGVILPLFRAIRDAAQFVADAVNKVFGPKITGGQLIITALLLQLLGVFKLVGSAVGVVTRGLALLVSGFRLLTAGGALGGAVSLFRLLLAGAGSFLALIPALVGWPALRGAGGCAAGAAIVIFWDDIKAAALAAWEFIRSKFSSEGFQELVAALGVAGAQIGAALMKGIEDGLALLASVFSPENLQAFFTAMTTAGQQAGAFFVTAIRNALASLFADGGAGFVTGLVTFLRSTFLALPALIADVIVNFGGQIGSLLLEAFKLQFIAINALFAGLAEFVVGFVTGAAEQVMGFLEPFFGEVIAKAQELWNQVVELVATTAGQVGDAVSKAFNDAFAAVQSGFDELLSFASRVIAKVGDLLSSIVTRIQNAIRALARLAGIGGGDDGGSKTSGFAAGGHVRGAGGPKSDSIWARLSNGEFVINAAATKAWLPILHAINSFRISPQDLLKGFSFGGLVDGVNASFAGMVPKMAAGGPVPRAPAGGGNGPAVYLQVQMGGGQERTLVIPTTEDAVTQVAKFVTNEARIQTGRPQSWLSTG